MGLYDTYQTDKGKEKEGIDLQFEDVTITLIRAGVNNRDYTNMLTAKTKNRRKISNQESIEILADVYSKTVIKGWQGVTDADGNALEFTPENCKKVLIDLPDFFQILQREAEDLENFRTERQEEDIKK